MQKQAKRLDAFEAYRRGQSSAGTEVTLPNPTFAAEAPHESVALDALPLFASLSPQSRQRLLAAASVRRYAAGSTLFRAGDEPVGLFVVIAGQVRVLRSRAGRQRVIHSEGPGGTLGEVPLFEGGTMPATAEAVTDVRCLLLPGASLNALLREDSSLALLFLRRLAERVRGLVERLDRDATLPLTSRLAAFLLERSVGTPGAAFTLGMTQEELAEELGTVREVIVRGLAHLRELEVISAAGRGRYNVRDADALQRLAVGVQTPTSTHPDDHA